MIAAQAENAANSAAQKKIVIEHLVEKNKHVVNNMGGLRDTER